MCEGFAYHSHDFAVLLGSTGFDTYIGTLT